MTQMIDTEQILRDEIDRLKRDNEKLRSIALHYYNTLAGIEDAISGAYRSLGG